jgi:hypothetical protein
MGTAPSYKLKLHKSYYDKGFFNLGIDVDRFVRRDNGPIFIELGDAHAEICCEVDRDANANGTPRIMGGAELRNWFHRSFKELDVVEVTVVSPDRLKITAAPD